MKSLRFLHKKLLIWQNCNSIVIPYICVVCESLETSTEEFIAKYLCELSVKHFRGYDLRNMVSADLNPYY